MAAFTAAQMSCASSSASTFSFTRSSSSSFRRGSRGGGRSAFGGGGATRRRGYDNRATSTTLVVAAAAAAAASSSSDDDGFGPNSLGTLGAAIELRSRLQDVDLERREKRGGRDGDGWEEINGAWVRSPPGRAWGVAHFIGGAVLGSYPHVAYDAFLARLCDEAGVVVVATPYELGTNHAAISAECQGKLAAAWGAVAAREGYNASATPVFAVGHSLGKGAAEYVCRRRRSCCRRVHSHTLHSRACMYPYIIHPHRLPILSSAPCS